MDELNILSTSDVSADVDDIVLRETKTTQLIFRPVLVENPNDRNASVRGNLLYRRKGLNEVWNDVATKPLTSLKIDEGFQLTFHSYIAFKLFFTISSLY